jgi:hypothetical protein
LTKLRWNVCKLSAHHSHPCTSQSLCFSDEEHLMTYKNFSLTLRKLFDKEQLFFKEGRTCRTKRFQRGGIEQHEVKVSFFLRIFAVRLDFLLLFIFVAFISSSHEYEINSQDLPICMLHLSAKSVNRNDVRDRGTV